MFDLESVMGQYQYRMMWQYTMGCIWVSANLSTWSSVLGFYIFMVQPWKFGFGVCLGGFIISIFINVITSVNMLQIDDVMILVRLCKGHEGIRSCISWDDNILGYGHGDVRFKVVTCLCDSPYLILKSWYLRTNIRIHNCGNLERISVKI